MPRKGSIASCLGFVNNKIAFLYFEFVKQTLELRAPQLGAKPLLETSMSKSCHCYEPILFFQFELVPK